MRHAAIILALLAAAACCYAQSGKNDGMARQGTDMPTAAADSIPVPGGLRDSLYMRHDFIDASFPAAPVIVPAYPLGLAYRYVPGLSYAPSFAVPGVIYQGNGMALTGAAGATRYPGMMNKETGMLGTSFGNGRVDFYVGGVVNKYGFYGGMLRQLGMAGRFTWQISSPFSFTAFAYYYGNNALPVMPNGKFMPPSMLGYYDVSRFGGYVNYNASEHFGIQAGGQVVQRMGSWNYYEFEPIVTPYINVGRGKKKVEIGLPVGQIIYYLLGK